MRSNDKIMTPLGSSDSWLRRGFTIVELLVVITVIGILSTVVLVSYTGWQRSIIAAQLKSDLVAAASAMESSRTFNNTYPASVPSSFNSSPDVTVSGGSGDGKIYCLDAISSKDATIHYYIDQDSGNQGAQLGTCAGRPVAPMTPVNLAAAATSGSTINLTWDAVTGANSYIVQKSTNAPFSDSSTIATPTSNSASSNSLSTNTTYYYRVRAVNAYGQSNWSTVISAMTLILPSAPANFVAITASSTAINLTWDAVSGATGYVVQQASSDQFSDASTIATPTSNSASSSSLLTFTTYYYRVQTVNANGSSGWSTTASATTLHGCTVSPNLYGVYPDCYAYDSLPVATSISGYWSTVPSGYLLEDGSAVSRTTYSDLFAAIGTTYGVGDGSTTFNLPNSKGRVAVNKNSSDAEFATIGQKYGEKAHTLTVAEIPPHQHGVRTEYGTGMYLISGPPGQYNQPTNNAGFGFINSYTQADGGGGGAHNTIQPSIVKVFAIKYRLPTGSTSTLPVANSIAGYWLTAPTGYLVEDGSAVSRTTYSDLFAAIGTAYGVGDGSTTFNLPDSRGRVAVNKNSSDAEFATLGQKYGEKVHTLSVAEIPPHQHGIRTECGTNANLAYNPPSQYNQLTTNAGYGFQTAYTQADGGGGGAHNNIQPSIVKLFVIKSSPASGTVDVPAKGTSIQGYWSSAPSGYLLEDGSAVSRTTYSDLFAVVGTTYGVGDGSTTFNLPDSRGRVVVNRNTADTEFTTIGQKPGEKVHTLSVAEIPSHQHNIRAEYGAAGMGAYPPPSNYNQLTNNAGYGFQTAYTRADGGGGASHNNIQPSIVQMFAIRY
jgi:prepilin-type N-terminal cleavage/methylation domain-containing protein